MKNLGVSFLILDYNRAPELELLLKSIKDFVKVPHEIVLLSNGGNQEPASVFYANGLVDTLILNKKNNGCGLGTRQLFNSTLAEYVFYVQSDQFLIREITESTVEHWKKTLNEGYFYIDLAGNQGHGNYSERAHFMKRSDYVNIPGLPSIVGGPGPYANERWTENFLQEYIKNNNLKLFHETMFFLDNGKRSIREYPCGGILELSTDTKRLYIHKPISKRVDFPNLLLTDEEWSLILSGKWQNGTIPQLHKDSSFYYWTKPYEISDFKK